MITQLWPTRGLVEDNWYPSGKHVDLASCVPFMFLTSTKFCNIPAKDVLHPDVLLDFKCMIYAEFAQYLVGTPYDANDFSLDTLQLHSVPTYNKQMASEYILEPHTDTSSGGFFAVMYYIDLDMTTEYVGGELALYSNLNPVDYPHNVIHITPVPNRLVIFPGGLIHRVKPYFGKTPRYSLAAVFHRTGGDLSNQQIVTL